MSVYRLNINVYGLHARKTPKQPSVFFQVHIASLTELWSMTQIN